MHALLCENGQFWELFLTISFLTYKSMLLFPDTLSMIWNKWKRKRKMRAILFIIAYYLEEKKYLFTTWIDSFYLKPSFSNVLRKSISWEFLGKCWSHLEFFYTEFVNSSGSPRDAAGRPNSKASPSQL